MRGFCVKCKKQKDIKDGKGDYSKTRDGDKPIVRGICPDCGTTVIARLGEPEIDVQPVDQFQDDEAISMKPTLRLKRLKEIKEAQEKKK